MEIVPPVSQPTNINVKKKLHALHADADLQARLGAAIRAGRHQLKLSQEELAWQADMHRTYIADIERGARNVTLRTVAKLARALQIGIGHLFAHATAPLEKSGPGDGSATHREVQEILLVEPNVTAAAATARAFKQAKLANPIRIVRSGEAALDYLFGTGAYAKPKPVRPQLILLVLDLPEMSGSQFLRRIKNDERTHDIPVVLLTVSHRLRHR